MICYFFLGLRRGELVALKWKNIDIVNGVVSITSSMEKVTGKGLVLSTPKTKSSYRKIVCNKTLIDEIKEYYFEVKSVFPKTNELFEFGKTKNISFATLDRRLKKYLSIAGTPKITMHGFRHSHATLLNELTSDLKAISARLGHDDISTTLKIYVHSNVKTQENLAQLIENELQKERQYDDFGIFISELEKYLLGGLESDKFSLDEIHMITDIYQYVISQKEKSTCIQ
ncbi:MAG: site-specific integrase [Erysipelotrichaceae bacterium]|nr:site-specific integrase [Erysipelotrichaceae bacterium]